MFSNEFCKISKDTYLLEHLVMLLVNRIKRSLLFLQKSRILRDSMFEKEKMFFVGFNCDGSSLFCRKRVNFVRES